MAAQITGFQEELRQAQEGIVAETEAREAVTGAAAEECRAGDADLNSGDDGAENAAGAENTYSHHGKSASGGTPAMRTAGGGHVPAGAKNQPFARHSKAPVRKPPTSKAKGRSTGPGPVESVSDGDEMCSESSEGGESDDEMDDESGSSDSESEDSGDDWGAGRAKAAYAPGKDAGLTPRRSLRSNSSSPEKASRSTASEKVAKNGSAKAVKAIAKGRVHKKATTGKHSGGKVRARPTAKAVRGQRVVG